MTTDRGTGPAAGLRAYEITLSDAAGGGVVTLVCRAAGPMAAIDQAKMKAAGVGMHRATVIRLMDLGLIQ